MASKQSKKHGHSKYQQQLAINSTKIPKRPEEEIGNEITMLGKDWGMGGEFLARAFKCYVVRYDSQKNWRRKNIPQGSLFVKCHADSYTEEEAQLHNWDMQQETELDLVNYGRLRHLYLSHNPKPATQAQAAQNPAAIDITEAEQKVQGSKDKRSPVYQFIREISPDEYAGFTHQCLLCGELLN